MQRRYLVRFGFLLFLGSTPAGLVQAEDPPGTMRDVPASVELRANVAEAPLDAADGRPIVTGTINGHGPLRILIDTGSTHAVVDDDVRKTAGLKPAGTTRLLDGPLSRAGDLPTVTLDSVVLGEATFSGGDAAVVDLDAETGGKRSYDAALGLPFFTNCVVTLNYVGGKLLLQKGQLPPPDGGQILAYTLERGRATIPLKSGDHTIGVGIDTASANALVLGPADQAKVRTQTLLGLSGDTSRYICDVDVVTPRSKDPLVLGRFKLLTVPITIRAHGSTIGSDLLRRFTVAFDAKNGRVQFQSVDETVNLTPVSKYGFVFSRTGDGLMVDAVFPGSPAETSAVKEGDFVRTVERKALSAYSDDELRHMLRTQKSILVIVDKSGMPLMVVVRSVDYD